ncbi:hypothetical protein HZA98_01295, partial [Candidatus Woesearchaeota archaeon]|nr:hypothetical protein [Candidatus Woesearchaeota archaeon]
ENIIEEVYGVNSKTADDQKTMTKIVNEALNLKRQGLDSSAAVLRITTADFKDVSRYLVQDVVDHIYNENSPDNPYLQANIFNSERMSGRRIIGTREEEEQRLRQQKEESERRLQQSKDQQKMIDEQIETVKKLAENEQERRKKLAELQKLRQKIGVRSAFPALAGYNLPDEFFTALMLHKSENELRKMSIGYQKEGRITQEDAQRILEYIKQPFFTGSGFSNADRSGVSWINSNGELEPGSLRGINDVNNPTLDSEERRRQIAQGDFRNIDPKSGRPWATQADLLEAARQKAESDPDLRRLERAYETPGSGRPVLNKWRQEDENETEEIAKEIAEELPPTPEEIESGEAASSDRTEFPKWVLSTTKTEDKHAIARDVKALHVAIDAYIGMVKWNVLLKRAQGKDKRDARVALEEMWNILFDIEDMMENPWKYN